MLKHQECTSVKASIQRKSIWDSMVNVHHNTERSVDGKKNKRVEKDSDELSDNKQYITRMFVPDG